MSDYVEQPGDVIRDADGVVWMHTGGNVINPWSGVWFGEAYDALETEQLAQPVTLLVRDGKPVSRTVDVVFDGPPAHESGRFVECEDESGASVGVGEWIDRGNGLWALRIAVAS